MSVERREPAPGADALLFATAHTDAGEPAALLPIADATALRMLMSQLVSLGIERIRVLAEPEWQRAIEAEARATGAEVDVVPTGEIVEGLGATAELARSRSGPLVIAAASLVAHREALAGVLADERTGAPALVAEDGRLGIVKIARSDREGLARAAEELAELVRAEPGRARDDGALDSGGPLPLLLVGLIRAVTSLRTVDVPGYVTAPRSRDEAQAATALAAAAEDQARLDAAVKTYDGFFSTFCVNPYTKHLARLAARLGLSPNVVTLASLATGIAAAACFALGSRTGLVTGTVLLLGSFYLDGVDGTLARYTRSFSGFGAWLDSMCDRAKEYLVYAGLAVGSLRGFDDDVWLLAACALALQTVRHVGDVAYVTAGRSRLSDTVSLSPGHAADRDVPSAARRALAAARRSAVPKWGHRIIRFPVGERVLLVSLTATLATPRGTFVALLAWGGLAAVYTVVGRVAYDHATTRRAVRELLG
jgi:phosphatidylglycerophosphate synthase